MRGFMEHMKQVFGQGSSTKGPSGLTSEEDLKSLRRRMENQRLRFESIGIQVETRTAASMARQRRLKEDA